MAEQRTSWVAVFSTKLVAKFHRDIKQELYSTSSHVLQWEFHKNKPHTHPLTNVHSSCHCHWLAKPTKVLLKKWSHPVHSHAWNRKLSLHAVWWNTIQNMCFNSPLSLLVDACHMHYCNLLGITNKFFIQTHCPCILLYAMSTNTCQHRLHALQHEHSVTCSLNK